MRINVGCGQSPTDGWRNFDNSPSLRLSRLPFATFLLRRMRILDERQYQFIQFARANAIEFGDAASRLPLAADSVEVLYSSHMLEHLDRVEALRFLEEVRRVLRAGGILRLAVPDLRRHVNRYLESNDADALIAATELTQLRARSLARRLRALVAGSRNHQWMYDGESLARLVRSAGFVDVQQLDAGETTIADPQSLDLRERCDESVYLEAKKSSN